MALYGAPALFGLDLSKRAGLASIVPQDLWGAGVSTVSGVTSNFFAGNYNDALRALSPGAWNIMTAIRGESYDKRGRVNDVYDDLYSRILRGIGFKSVDETLPSDRKRIINRAKSSLVKEKQQAIDEYLANPTTKNAKRLKELDITPKQVENERKKKQTTRRERLAEGLSDKQKERYKNLLDF